MCERTSTRLRLVHVIGGLDIGGAESMLLQLVEQWQSIGHKNLIVALMTGGQLGPKLASTGAKIVELGLKRNRPLSRAILQLGALYSDFQPDLAQGWMYHGNLAASLGRLLAGTDVPVLWSIHNALSGHIVPKLLTRFLIYAGARLSPIATRIVYCSAVSAGQHEQLGYDRRRTVVIPNGVDAVRFRPKLGAGSALRAQLGLPLETRIVGLFARFDPIKDPVNLLIAIARLRAKGMPVHLIMAGSGFDTFNMALSAKLDNLSLGDHVTLLGMRNDIALLMPGLDIFALPSLSEAFPNVLIEAMAAGVPCVATDVGDCAAILGGTGLVVPPRDPDRLAAAMERLLAEPAAERARRGAAARERVLAEFALPSVAARYLDLYACVLAGRAAPRRAATDGASICAD